MKNDVLNRIEKGNMRDSNMELLRIVAMLLVLVTHADFRALSTPGIDDYDLNATSVIFRFFYREFLCYCS